MPLGDRTGPNGFGPRTGRGLGYCSGYSTPGYMTGGRGYGRGSGYGYGGGYGRGYGRGFGRGFGYSRRFYSGNLEIQPAYYVPSNVNPKPEDVLKQLENEKKLIEEDIKRWKEIAKKESTND